MDYAGICILIYGSMVGPFIYGFYCHQIYSWIYLTIFGILSALVFTVSLFDITHT